jgi:YgiT-type zinc finger domain-containing protein
MFNCHICYSEESHTEYVHKIFEIDRQFHLVENIPATVCSRCGEEIFSNETTETIRVMLHSQQKPLRAINK